MGFTTDQNSGIVGVAMLGLCRFRQIKSSDAFGFWFRTSIEQTYLKMLWTTITIARELHTTAL